MSLVLAPCVTLKECIDNRPDVPPGYCLEDETIQCRDDSECPIKPGLCTDEDTANPSAGTCTSDQTCPKGSVCDYDDSIYSECWYKPGTFEEWAEGFVIDDASNQTQCESARVSLGLQFNEYDDAYACEQFIDIKCDPGFFDDVDVMAEENPPRTTTTVAYNDIV